MVAAPHADVGILGGLLSRLLRLGIANIDNARHDERLCASLAFGKAAIKDDLI
jgi:hypothetical protein